MSGASDPISKRRPGATQKARTLRQKETEAEYRLWSEIRNRLLNGYKFSSAAGMPRCSRYNSRSVERRDNIPMRLHPVFALTDRQNHHEHGMREQEQ
ncbi:DUF559 domain-containing protein [Pararhizobium sp. LjRoot235]|uniref:DUF559 domain-containing protein n=1 Tax=Pararhizobium sp. LjRoot235 TaxID=3342291 RepID=UPI003ED0E332